MTKNTLKQLAPEILEALDKLPDDVNIYGVVFDDWEDSLANKFINLQLLNPIEWPAVFDGQTFKSGAVQKRIVVTPHIRAWWSEGGERDG